MKSSLTSKMLGAFVSLSIILTLLFSTVSAMRNYYIEMNRIEESYTQIVKKDIPVLAEQIWIFRYSEAELNIAGMMNISYLSDVTVYNERGEKLIEKGEKTTKESIIKSNDIYYTGQGEKVFVGKIVIEYSKDKVKEKIFKDLAGIIIFQALQMALLAIFLFTMVKVKIISNITRIRDFFKGVGYDTLNTRLTLAKKFGNRRDEIDELGDAINNMTENMEKSIEEREGLLKQIRERETELSKSLIEAENANRAKNEFLSNMSHEIRTPLNGIVGMVNLLQTTELTNEQKEFLKIMDYSCERVVAVISDILDIAKIESGKMELNEREFSIIQNVDKVIDTMSIAAKTKGIEIIKYIDPKIEEYLIGDKDRLIQILINLINNAVKFTEKGEVFCELTQKNDLGDEITLEIKVKDTGIGISKENQQKIFERFYQVDSSNTRKAGGNGLGLAIVKKLSEMMAGGVTVESLEGLGSIFTVTVKLKKSGRESESRLGEKPLSIGKILIIDDNATNRMIIEKMLESWGGLYVSAENGMKALEILEEQNEFSALVVDYQMPEMDGIEFLIKAKEKINFSNTRIIMLTSADIKSICEKEEMAGIDVCIYKPVKRSELYLALTGNIIKKIKTEVKKHEKGNYKGKVLLVEDNHINIIATETILKNAGYEIAVACNGKEAVYEFEKGEYDIILMDIEMPVMNGRDAAREIKKTVKGKKTPIIAVTAYAMKNDLELCIEAGMDGYIAKPYNPDDLIEMIEQHIRGENRVKSQIE